MKMALYDELTPWYRLLDATRHHVDEAAIYEQALRFGIEGEAKELLELGAGAGNNAYFLKDAFACTLTDPSEAMLGLSKEINPECEHIPGDMRSLRLDRTFDAVLVHDAIVYMTTLSDVRAALETAFIHLRPGGAAVFAPDCTQDSFTEATTIHEGVSDDGERELRCLDWMRDPNPDDNEYVVDYAFLLRDGDEVRAVHERHVEGLFSDADWLQAIKAAGFNVEKRPRAVDDDEPYVDHFYLARRPAT